MTYKGERNAQGTHVETPDGSPLSLRLDVQNHSPTGFEWGYSGSGPAQLSLALLCHRLKDERRACLLYQKFKCDVISNILNDKWELKPEKIDSWVAVTEASSNR